jgi:hypothetical protein
VKAVEEITKDLRTQYTLAFYPTSSGTEKYHEVRVSDWPILREYVRPFLIIALRAGDAVPFALFSSHVL